MKKNPIAQKNHMITVEILTSPNTISDEPTHIKTIFTLIKGKKNTHILGMLTIDQTNKEMLEERFKEITKKKNRYTIKDIQIP